MTEAEALDMAARAAGWEYYNIARYNDGDAESIRAHAKTIMELAELMTTCEEATTRMELMYLQHQKVVDENAALKAEIERLREAVGILEDGLQEVGDDYPGSSCQEWCQHQIKQARAALKEIDNGDR